MGSILKNSNNNSENSYYPFNKPNPLMERLEQNQSVEKKITQFNKVYKSLEVSKLSSYFN